MPRRSAGQQPASWGKAGECDKLPDTLGEISSFPIFPNHYPVFFPRSLPTGTFSEIENFELRFIFSLYMCTAGVYLSPDIIYKRTSLSCTHAAKYLYSVPIIECNDAYCCCFSMTLMGLTWDSSRSHLCRTKGNLSSPS